ncbi:zinc finger protein 2-like [Rhopalosiphum maidis]|uniref:zinc finger protein 2-like n=1 Tax=Rhopalosiphum maidis TaxID=43146 RepID=UPI000F00083C|nr:zinc finger protein 2-like [Rhopalosiphum maidis]
MKEYRFHSCQKFIDFSLDPTECPNMCGRSYRGKFRKSSLRRHLIYECGVDPQFKCPVCLKPFTDKGKHVLPDPLYCQNNCGRYYTGKKRKSSLKRHITYECGIDPQFKYFYAGQRFKCPNECGKSYKNKYTLKRHIFYECGGYDYDQLKKTRFFCPNNCGKSYKFSNTLNRHVKYECGDLRSKSKKTSNYTCPNKSCNKIYKSKGSYFNHVNYECGGRKQFECWLCNKKFSQKGLLSEYRRQSNLSISYKFTCPNCCRRYSHKPRLVHHLKHECGYKRFIYSDTKQLRYFCPNNCGKSYKIKRSVGRHLKFKCGVEPTFECWICHRKFALKESMKKHMMDRVESMNSRFVNNSPLYMDLLLLCPVNFNSFKHGLSKIALKALSKNLIRFTINDNFGRIPSKIKRRINSEDEYQEIEETAGLNMTFLTLPVTQIACERSFSTLKFIKNRLRNTLTYENLEAFIFMSVEKRKLASINDD